MKKILALLAALVFVFALAGCGEYNPPDEKPSYTPPPVTDDQGKDDPNPDDTQTSFSVTLTYLGQGYYPGDGVYALWYEIGGNGIYRALFDKNGVAKTEGLDGDYRVTLSAIPDGFTYNPNSEDHIATNDNKNISITLYPLTPYTGEGKDMTSDVITLSTIGAYRATLTSPSHVINFQFKPSTAGDYSITSIIDVTANVLNPLLDLYIRNSGGYNMLLGRYDGGGAANTYTKNFRWELGLDTAYVGNVYAFAISADALSADAFPVNIDFILDKDGEFSGAKPVEYIPVPVTENFIEVPDAPEDYTFNYAASLKSNKLLDQSQFALGEDGYYHFYDEETKTLGALLYVKITSANEVMDTGFTNGLVNKRANGKDYNAMVAAYGEHVNNDGVYPVTAEFKAFLMDYANAGRLFNDGNGTAETWAKYNSALEDQWLFACGFYTTGGAYNYNGGGGTITDLPY